MTTMLDRPVWHSLNTHHKALSIGGDRARRFHPEVNLFASGPDDRLDTMEHVAALVPPDGQIYVLQVPDITIPPSLRAPLQAKGVQMVYRGADLSAYGDEDIIPLGDGDAAEMLDLATLTEPGPFLKRTHEMAQFFGVRIEGRLAAMAGERMRFPGFSEVSGVCTHPDFGRRGLAKRLSAYVTRQILARGETPFLHAWATNEAAIALYESLGFVLRCEVNAAVLARAPAAATAG